MIATSTQISPVWVRTFISKLRELGASNELDDLYDWALEAWSERNDLHPALAARFEWEDAKRA